MSAPTATPVVAATAFHDIDFTLPATGGCSAMAHTTCSTTGLDPDIGAIQVAEVPLLVADVFPTVSVESSPSVMLSCLAHGHGDNSACNFPSPDSSVELATTQVASQTLATDIVHIAAPVPDARSIVRPGDEFYSRPRPVSWPPWTLSTVFGAAHGWEWPLRAPSRSPGILEPNPWPPPSRDHSMRSQADLRPMLEELLECADDVEMKLPWPPSILRSKGLVSNYLLKITCSTIVDYELPWCYVGTYWRKANSAWKGDMDVAVSAQTIEGPLILHYPGTWREKQYNGLIWQYCSCKGIMSISATQYGFDSFPWYIAWLLVEPSCAQSDFGGTGNLTNMWQLSKSWKEQMSAFSFSFPFFCTAVQLPEDGLKSQLAGFLPSLTLAAQPPDCYDTLGILLNHHNGIVALLLGVLVVQPYSTMVQVTTFCPKEGNFKNLFWRLKKYTPCYAWRLLNDSLLQFSVGCWNYLITIVIQRMLRSLYFVWHSCEVELVIDSFLHGWVPCYLMCQTQWNFAWLCHLILLENCFHSWPTGRFSRSGSEQLQFQIAWSFDWEFSGVGNKARQLFSAATLSCVSGMHLSWDPGILALLCFHDENCEQVQAKGGRNASSAFLYIVSVHVCWFWFGSSCSGLVLLTIEHFEWQIAWPPWSRGLFMSPAIANASVQSKFTCSRTPFSLDLWLPCVAELLGHNSGLSQWIIAWFIKFGHSAGACTLKQSFPQSPTVWHIIVLGSSLETSIVNCHLVLLLPWDPGESLYFPAAYAVDAEDVKLRSSVPWDPGGPPIYRLGGKPNFMERGMSATIYPMAGLATGCTVGPWAGQKLPKAATTNTRAEGQKRLAWTRTDWRLRPRLSLARRASVHHLLPLLSDPLPLEIPL